MFFFHVVEKKNQKIKKPQTKGTPITISETERQILIKLGGYLVFVWVNTADSHITWMDQPQNKNHNSLPAPFFLFFLKSERIHLPFCLCLWLLGLVLLISFSLYFFWLVISLFQQQFSFIFIHSVTQTTNLIFSQTVSFFISV